MISDALMYLHTGKIDSEIHTYLNTVCPTKSKILKTIKFICLNRTANENDNDDNNIEEKPMPDSNDLKSTLAELMEKSIRNQRDKFSNTAGYLSDRTGQ